MRSKIICIVSLVFVSICFMTPSWASQTTFKFSGYISYLPNTGTLPDDFSSIFYDNQTFTGYITFDSEAPATDQSPDGNDVQYTGAISSFQIEFADGLYAKFNNGGIRIQNDRDTGGGSILDSFVANARTDFGSMPTAVDTNIDTPNWSVEHIYMYLADNTAKLFDNTDLPTEAPNMYDTSRHIFFFQYGLDSGTADYQISCKIDMLETCTLSEECDFSAPTPTPMVFEIEPQTRKKPVIKMRAAAASDTNGVEYFFEEVTHNPGGSDSGWQDSPFYSDRGLSKGTQYGYRVRARDKSTNKNTTEWSDIVYVITKSKKLRRRK